MSGVKHFEWSLTPVVTLRIRKCGTLDYGFCHGRESRGNAEGKVVMNNGRELADNWHSRVRWKHRRDDAFKSMARRQTKLKKYPWPHSSWRLAVTSGEQSPLHYVLGTFSSGEQDTSHW